MWQNSFSFIGVHRADDFFVALEAIIAKKYLGKQESHHIFGSGKKRWLSEAYSIYCQIFTCDTQ